MLQLRVDVFFFQGPARIIQPSLSLTHPKLLFSHCQKRKKKWTISNDIHIVSNQVRCKGLQLNMGAPALSEYGPVRLYNNPVIVPIPKTHLWRPNWQPHRVVKCLAPEFAGWSIYQSAKGDYF